MADVIQRPQGYPMPAELAVYFPGRRQLVMVELVLTEPNDDTIVVMGKIPVGMVIDSQRATVAILNQRDMFDVWHLTRFAPPDS